MIQKRRKYDKAFKLRAIELAEIKGSFTLVAEEMGINVNLLYRWRRQFDQDEKNSFPGQGNKQLTDEQREIERLKKELADSKMETEILKKAISIFSARDGKSTNL
jgi:transposase